MRAIPLGIQAYSLREQFKADGPGTFAAIAKMGFWGVEMFNGAKDSVPAVGAALRDNGLACMGWHTQVSDFKDENLEQTIAYHTELGNQYCIIPWLDEVYRKTRDDALRTAEWLTKVATRLRGHGIQLGFHNHDIEFIPYADGVSFWDLLAQNTPDDFVMQLDTGNALSAGIAAADYIQKYAGRSQVVHLKSYSKAEEFDALPGQDDVDWKRIFALCDQVGGTQSYILEYEGTPGPNTAAEVARQIQALQAMQCVGLTSFMTK